MTTQERKELYQKEQDEILKNILEWNFFGPWREYKPYDMYEKEDKLHIAHEKTLELFITPTCNQNCSYCYLVKYNDKLYPKEINDFPTILKNMEILLNYFIDQDYYVPEMTIFTGEIWHSQFGLDILELLYKKIQEGFQTDYILIPSNCSFLLDKKQTGKIQQLIERYRDIHVCLTFSISVDGMPIEELSRPMNDKTKKRTEEFYQSVFDFAKHNNFYFHPMVSAYNVKYWCENLDWWVEMLYKYERNSGDIMLLEVRNDDWTDENIADYCKFLDHLFEIQLQENELGGFIRMILGDPTYPIYKSDGHGYIPTFVGLADNFPGCTVAKELTIRLGDLAIVPCHRTCYPKNVYGKFVIKDNQIIDIVSNNVYLAERILMVNNITGSLKCDTCAYAGICLQGCFGAQLEANGDPFITNKSVCKLFKTKYYHLIQLYHKYGIMDMLEKMTPYQPGYLRAQELLQIMKRVEDDYERNNFS